MSFKLEFDTDNDAFSSESARIFEICRILSLVVLQVSGRIDSGVVQDISGNTIGRWEITASHTGLYELGDKYCDDPLYCPTCSPSFTEE